MKKVDDKVRKVAVSIEDEDVIDHLNRHLQTLKRHIYVKRIQNATFNNLKANLAEGEVLLQIDYSENYANKDQRQIQSAYFGQQCFSIFTACCYFKKDGDIVNENFTVTSEASDHSRIAALSLYCIVLYCIVLYCIVLYCIVLYCIVLYCIVLYCIVLYCIVLYCIVLYCIVLYCIVLYCIVLYCIVLYCIVLYCIVLYCIVLYCIVLYCIVLYCIVLYCIVL